MPDLRIGPLQWTVGAFCMVVGALILVAPHHFDAPTYAALRPHLLWWGVAFLLAGAALVAAPLTLRGRDGPARRPALVATHLVAGAALLWLAGGFTLGGHWTGTISYAVLGLGTGLAPLLLRTPQRSPASGCDLFALLMGLSAALNGLTILALPDQFSASTYDLARSTLPWHGAALLGSGLVLAATQVRPFQSRVVSGAAYLLAAGAFFAFLVAVPLPIGHWTGIAYYGGFGAALALLPWLGPSLRRVDMASLRARLALALGVAAALPLIVVGALDTNKEEQEVTAQALAQQQALAMAFAHDVYEHVSLYRGAVAALAVQPGLLELAPQAQEALLQKVERVYPEVVAFSTYDAAGNSIARSGGGLPHTVAGLAVYEDVRRTDRPALEIQLGPPHLGPLLLLGAPVRDAGENFAGLVLASVQLERLAALLDRAAAAPSREVYVVDRRGRLIANGDEALLGSLADRSTAPPVAALLAGAGVSGALGYSDASGQQLAGYARVRGLGWGVVVEMPSTLALGTFRAGRELAFGLLLLWISVAALAGAKVAGWLAAPLRALTRAVDQLAAGRPSAPLPQGGTTEVERLANAFGEMRQRLAARTVELERAEAKFRGLVESAPDAVVAVACADGRMVLANAQAERLFGYERAELLNRPVELLLPGHLREVHVRHRATYSARCRALASVDHQPQPMLCRSEAIGRRKDGTQVPIECGRSLLESGDGVLVICVIRDLTERKRAEEERAQLIREQAARAEAEGRAEAMREANQRLTVATVRAQGLAEQAHAVAELGRRALAGVDLSALLDDAVALIARTLEVEYAEVLEVLPGGTALRVRAGVGWQGSCQGGARVDVEAESLASYTLLAQEPVVVEEMRADPRCARSLLVEHGVVSSLSLPIPGREQPFGVLGAHTTRRRTFSQDEVHFLQAVANVLATAIERRRAEEERAQLAREHAARAEAEAQQARFQAILESTAHGILYIEAETGRVIANPAASRVFGQSFMPEVGRTQYLPQVCRPDGRRLTLEELPSSRALRGETVREEELVNVRPDGQRIPIVASAAPVRAPDGRVTGAVVAFQDISALKELERLRDEWTSIIAHDLRQPVTIITAYAGLLARLAARQQAPPEEQMKGTEHILASARQLNRMIGDLLDVSRLEAGRLTLEQRPVDLRALVGEVVERSAELTQGHRIRMRVAADLPPLKADAQRVEQVLGNLLSNAAKYGEPGTEILVEVGPWGEEVQVAVANRGAGIPPEEIPHLFTRFHRTRQARAGPVQGLGLGLYISYGLVQAHGGRMWVESTPGQTTTFRFTLPAALSGEWRVASGQ